MSIIIENILQTPVVFQLILLNLPIIPFIESPHNNRNNLKQTSSAVKAINETENLNN